MHSALTAPTKERLRRLTARPWWRSAGSEVISVPLTPYCRSTAVPPVSRYGVMDAYTQGQVLRFGEKAKANGLISAGSSSSTVACSMIPAAWSAFSNGRLWSG